MTASIIQNHPTQGTRAFKLVDDSIEYRISGPFGDEELSVVLSVLSPEPVIDGSMLYFVSEVNREALIKLFIDLPDAVTFKKFVGAVQYRIGEEGFGKLAAANRDTEITHEQVETTVRMLETYLDSTNIDGLLCTLRRLAEAPEDPELLESVVTEFNALGVHQGPVLTYAPFFNSLLSSTDLDDMN